MPETTGGKKVRQQSLQVGCNVTPVKESRRKGDR